MVCSACGCDQVPGGQFCRQCGAQIAPAAPPIGDPQQGWMPLTGNPQGNSQYVAALVAEQRMRVRQNLQPLGIMWIMFGIFRVVTGFIGAFVIHNLVRGGVFSDAPPFVPHLMGSLAPFIATVSMLMGLGAVIAGYGLLARQPWARVVAIILAILSLLKLPFGTALGIYTLWVLAPRASWAEWEALSGRG